MSEPSNVQLLNTASVPPILSVLPELILISPETSSVCAGELLPIPTFPLESMVNLVFVSIAVVPILNLLLSLLSTPTVNWLLEPVTSNPIVENTGVFVNSNPSLLEY